MTMPGWMTRNAGLKLLAMLLAVVTWTLVTWSNNPPETRTFSAQVPQDAASLPGHFVLLKSIPDLPVNVVGLRDHLNSFNTASLQVTVQWSAVTRPGPQELPVTVKTTDDSVELDNPPTTVTADVDVLGASTSRFSVVQPLLTGSVSLGHELTGIAVVPAAVLVTGPTQQLANLSSISTAPVPLSGIDGSRTFQVAVVLPAGVTAAQNQVQVTITVTALPTPAPTAAATATPSP